MRRVPRRPAPAIRSDLDAAGPSGTGARRGPAATGVNKCPTVVGLLLGRFVRPRRARKMEMEMEIKSRGEEGRLGEVGW